jgi:hypothetical protein
VISLDAAAAAILRRLASHLGGSERMRQRITRVRHFGEPKADRQLDAVTFVVEWHCADRIAEAVDETRRRVGVAVEEEQRESIARNARRADIGFEIGLNRLGNSGDHIVANVHAVIFVDDMQSIDIRVRDAMLRA